MTRFEELKLKKELNEYEQQELHSLEKAKAKEAMLGYVASIYKALEYDAVYEATMKVVQLNELLSTYSFLQHKSILKMRNSLSPEVTINVSKLGLITQSEIFDMHMSEVAIPFKR